jgi:signal transduction histidine kinase
MEQGVQLPEMHAGAMARLASALNERPDLDWIYQTACDGLARVLAVESTFIVLYENAGQSYLPMWLCTHGSSQSCQRFPSFPAPPISQGFLKIGIPVVIHSAAIAKYLHGLDLPSSEIPQVLMLATLYHEGSKLGILGASTPDPNRIFLPHEIMRAQAIADQVAAAIVHARLFLAARKQALYLELTNEITRIALSGGKLKELLDHLACRVVETLFADGCYISLWEPNRKTLAPFSATGPKAVVFMGQPAEPDRSALWKAAIYPRLVLPGEEPNQWTALPNQKASQIDPAGAGFELRGPEGVKPALTADRPYKENHAHSVLITLPLMIGERKLGVIRVEYARPNSFVSTDDLSHWEEIASQITLAIINIQAIEQEKKHRQEAELLQQSTVAITSSLDLQEVLNLILTRLEQVVPFDSAAICLIEEDHLCIAALGGSAWHSRQVGETIDKSAGLFSLLETSRDPVFLADAQQHPSYEHWSQSGEVVIHGWMGVPLIADGNPTGYLLLNSRERDIYTPQSARLTQAFASQAAVAIEKARLFEQVRNGRERLHALSKKLVEIQEAERRYISHELHDEIGQQLTGLQFMLEMGKAGTKTGRLGALSEAQELVSGLMSQIRELSLNLHPSMIDDLGLMPALNAHFDRYQQKTGIRVQFIARDLNCRFPSEVEVSAFRVVQESLTNAARYAGVKEVEVSIFADEAALSITVSDQGRGFDTQLLQDSNRAFGVAGMRERVELAGGKFDIHSRPGEGTRITAVFPIHQMLERRKNDRKSPAGG